MAIVLRSDHEEPQSVVTSGNLDCSLLPGRLAVCHIPQQAVARSSWILLRVVFGFGSSGTSPYCKYLLYDDDGTVTFVAEEAEVVAMQNEGRFTFNDNVSADGLGLLLADGWRALQFHFGAAAGESQSAILNSVAKLLSIRGLSILNMTTYDSDLILVQQDDLECALDTLSLIHI